MRLAAGVRLGPYEVLALLGAGGMAEVYRARDTRLGREVAVKVVSEALGADGAFVERFEREARLVGSVNHPNVVALHDVGLYDGKPYFVTELLHGETLRTRLGKGPLPLATALDWAEQMAEGLAAAHERNIVHRDLKPENVLVTREGRIKLLDFGIAKFIAAAQAVATPGDEGPHGLLDETASSSGRTATGMVFGTPGYMSPEQIRGDPVDARTDLFSLGAVLYEMLSGHRAFPGSTAVESGYAILHQEPQSLPEGLPPSVVQVVRRCLEKDPGRRFHSAQDLAFHLDGLRAPTAVAASTAPAPQPRARPPRALVAGAAGVALVAVAALLGPSAFRTLVHRPTVQAAGAAVTPSIAVLPFVNLSSDKEQEYFSDGISEELLDALARVKGLKVAGRTSSFHFKGKNEDLRTIGETLGVANIVEGSVRKQGNRVRITAQLIHVADGFQFWSKTFDGDLTNVFDLQERIARTITGELKVVLQGDPQARLVPVATSSPEAYALFLESTAIFNRRDLSRFPDGIAQIREALRLDPGYARAWSRLGTLEVLLPTYRSGEFESGMHGAEEAARRAAELAPGLAEPQAVLALVQMKRRRLVEASEAFRRALEIDPDDVTANFWHAAQLLSEGYLRRGAERLDEVLRMDPIHPNALDWRGMTALRLGDAELADRLIRRARDLGLSSVGLSLSDLADARGNRAEAVEQLAAGLKAIAADLPPDTMEAIARGAYGDVRARDTALARIDRYLGTRPTVLNAVAPYALLRLGRTKEALALIASRPTSNDPGIFEVLWGPHGREARQSPEFSEFARRTGLVEIWEIEGPPDMCRRTGAGSYACQ